MKLSSCAGAALIVLFVNAGLALANSPPVTPVISQPASNGTIVNPEDVHMETAPFSDPDPGDTHVCTDFQIWTVSPSGLVWAANCLTGVERLHCHLGDGVFQGAYVGRTSLLPNTNYQLRARHKDSSGDPATEWSAFAVRQFTTAPITAVLPLELEDVVSSPTPAWNDRFGVPVILPGHATMPPRLLLESGAGSLLLEIDGDDGSANRIVNPPGLGFHVEPRVHVIAGATGVSLPEADLVVTDDHGGAHTIYLPAVGLAPGQEAFFWISSIGATYVGLSAQTQPDFATLARSAPVPWAVLQPGYRVDVVASGFQLPVNIAFVPNPGTQPTSPVFYVTELYGAIKVMRRDGMIGTYASGLLNFAPTGQFPGSGEQGVAGIVVDPATGDLFVGMLYDSAPPNGNHYPKVVRFHSNDGGLTAATQTIIKDMPGETQGQSHQISNFTIGPDGKLYVHMGDGFDQTRGQNLDSYRGKILRMNLDGTAVTNNPFYNAADGITSRDYVYAYGLRNPFGGAWRAADGLHYEVENGPNVDRFVKVAAGTNYLYDGSDASMSNGAIYLWNPAHGPVNMAFIQASTFGGSGFPTSKYDHMFISESGTTWGTGPQSNGKRIVEFVLSPTGALVSGPTKLIEYNGTGKASCVGLAAGPDGLYFTDLYRDLGYSSPIDAGANVLRVKFVGTADFTANVVTGPAPLNVQFTDASNAPGVSARSWSFGDGATSAAQNPSHTYAQEGAYTVRLALTTPNGLIVGQKNAYIRVGTVPKIALIGGSNPPAAADANLAAHLSDKGFAVTTYDDEPANRPSAATLGAQNNLVMVSSTITASNVAGQFRTVSVPLVFWEQAMLRTTAEALASGGNTVDNVTAINIVNNAHPATAGLSLGNTNVFSSAATMSVGQGTIATGATLLATRAGSSTDYGILACNAGASLLSGYVAPAKRVFLCIQDSSWLNATPAMQQIMDQSVCWSLGLGAPVITMPGGQTVYTGDTVQFAASVSSAPPAAAQWQRNGGDLSNGGRIAGATAPTLTIQNVRASDAGQYTLTATGACGTSVSPPLTLTVRIRGDVNCDNSLDAADVAAFALSLVDPAGYGAAYPVCPVANGDLNVDGSVDAADIGPFVAALLVP